METELFKTLITYVSKEESRSYKEIWGSGFWKRLKGKPEVHIKIACEESKISEKNYNHIKGLVPQNADLDNLILICERNICKYQSTGRLYTDFRIILFIGIALISAAFNLTGVLNGRGELVTQIGVFLILLVGTIAGMLFLAIKSNDSVGSSYCEILTMYLKRLKQERDALTKSEAATIEKNNGN
jgi:hypothetical protein